MNPILKSTKSETAQNGTKTVRDPSATAMLELDRMNVYNSPLPENNAFFKSKKRRKNYRK
jgi:hypothetical protein